MIVRLILCILVLSPFCEGYVRTTAEIAAAHRYPAFVTDYRNRAEKLLNSVIIETKLRVQKLASQNLFHRAQALQTFYASDFQKMQNTIDTFFVNFDDQFLITAKKLDEEDAPEKTKAAFVTTMQENIKRAFTTLLTYYSKKFNLLEQSQEEVMKSGHNKQQPLETTPSNSSGLMGTR